MKQDRAGLVDSTAMHYNLRNALSMFGTKIPRILHQAFAVPQTRPPIFDGRASKSFPRFSDTPIETVPNV